MKIRNIPFGYQTVNGIRVINEDEASVVCSIFCDYINGKTLKAISDRLTEQGILFWGEDRSWNKNRISRILEDKRYLGDQGFPKLIELDTYHQAQSVRNEKGAMKARLSPLLLEVKSKLCCGQCRAAFRRINKWRTREKWLCKGGCKCGRYLDDQTIVSGIADVMNLVIENPGILREGKRLPSYSPSVEVLRRINETNRILEQPNQNFKSSVSAILDSVSEKYLCCDIGDKNQVAEVLITEFESMPKLETLTEKVLEQTVEQILIAPSGVISVQFRGNMIVHNDGKGEL